MTDYSRWRSHESDFRELQRQYPELSADELSVACEWVVRGDGREAFESMAAIAAADAGHTGDKHGWLDHVRTFLLDRISQQITCIEVGSAAGLLTLNDRLDPDDPAVKRAMLCTIGRVCQASGDYCLELANLAKREELMSIAASFQEARKKSRTDPTSRGPEADAPFPRRAAWLRERLAERSWNHHDPARLRGPDSKTIGKILSGKLVREDVLEKLANSLSAKFTKLTVLDIPRD